MTSKALKKVLLAVCPLLLSVQPAFADSCANENSGIPFSTPASDFTLHDDGTATQSSTRLMWMRCSIGQSWDDSSCTGIASAMTWQSALAQQGINFAGYSDWRLPNKIELAAILEQRCWSPALNDVVFPNQPASYFWTSSAFGYDLNIVWGVNFFNGNIIGENKSSNNRVRLVRAGN